LIQPGPEPHYGIQLDFPGDQFPQGTISCPGDDPYTTSVPGPGLVYTPDPEQATVRGTYQGSSTFSNEFFVQNMNWSLIDP
jgi:hypothetical protein